MSLKIECIEKEGLASPVGLKQGDAIRSINGHAINDVIDLQFYSADEELDFEIQRGSEIFHIPIIREYDDDLGLSTEPMKMGHCGNHCIFCFIDQNPKNMRRPLYFKDEDYRLSFLHGNYVTLTAVHDSELERIADQQLSPLYISIHAIDPDVRRRMLGIKGDDRLLEKLQFLSDHHIEMHGQIVLCPGINDGSILSQTVMALSGFYPAMQSLAVVPIGLTRHRDKLVRLREVTSDDAKIVLQNTQEWQAKFLQKMQTRFVFAADEFYILSATDFPKSEGYEDFPQIENGVGLTRSFLDDLNEATSTFPKSVKSIRRIWVTGELVASILKAQALPKLNTIHGLNLELWAVKNIFYGDSVTVTGLLTGQDILQSLKIEQDEYELLIPPSCLNEDDLFLDDLTLSDLSRQLERPVRLLTDFKDFWMNPNA
ncbi:DUF512 domain-containing protein [candidate division KSB1 bacterium]|nr:DUF512 domain-containing protein [candidate division KSB1 bacterium]